MCPYHIITEKENIASNVLLPGDPLRAKYIAEKFLKDYKLVSSVRNMLVYTGYYNDKPITVMGSGMGIPSVSLYAYELYNFFNVENIIRIGTCGGLDKNLHVGDLVLSEVAYSESSFAYSWNRENIHEVNSSKILNDKIIKIANNNNQEIHIGPTLTLDFFDLYGNIDPIINDSKYKDKLKCVEMEGFGLFYIASKLNKNASMLTTIIDSKYDKSQTISPQEGKEKLDNMIILALNSLSN